MNIEDQVVNLELSKKLKEFRIKQESHFHWNFYNINPFSEDKWIVTTVDKNRVSDPGEYISAFTASELAEILPTRFYWKNNQEIESCENVYLQIIKYPDKYHISYVDHDDKWFDHIPDNIRDKNLANSLAKTVIYLLENNILCRKYFDDIHRELKIENGKVTVIE